MKREYTHKGAIESVPHSDGNDSIGYISIEAGPSQHKGFRASYTISDLRFSTRDDLWVGRKVKFDLHARNRLTATNVRPIQVNPEPTLPHGEPRPGTIDHLHGRHYGFLVDQATKQRVFFQEVGVVNDTWDRLSEGQTVEFTVGPSPIDGRSIAIEVRT